MSQPGPEGAPAVIAPVRRSPLRNLSWVWLVPLLALVMVGAVAWQTWRDRGVLIEIDFANAGGVSPGQTTVRLRDVIIGSVERTSFSPDLSRVQVFARISPEVAATLPGDAAFWVVRPEVSTRGIAGLDTVLSGVYIAGAWIPAERQEASRFAGLEQPPAIRPGQPGTRVVIRAQDGNRLAAGAPVLFHGLEVGRLEQPSLNGDGTVSVEAFIDAPNDARLTTATRFWDMSGFSVSLSTAGLTLNVASLASLVSGGVAFDNVFSGGRPLPQGFVFDLYADEAAARESVFSQVGANAVPFQVTFEGSVSGLQPGAPVTYRGLRVGQVDSLGAHVITRDGRQLVQMQSVIEINPQSMGLPLDAGRDELMALLSEKVAHDGLRAQLATQSLFSSALAVQLVEVADAPPAALETPEGQLPVLPATASDITDVTASAEGVMQRINALPVEELLNQAIDTLAAIKAVAASPETQAVPGNLNGLLSEARGVVGSEQVQELPAQIAAMLDEITAGVAELRQKGTADRLLQALASVQVAAESIGLAVEDVPGLVADLRALAQKAYALELERLVDTATSALESVDLLVASPGAQELPQAMTDALNELAAIIAEIREANTVDRLVRALDAAYDAALTVDAAGQGVPLLVEDLRQLVRKADRMDLEGLTASATRLLDSIDTLVASPDTQALPASLSAALDELRAALQEAREGGLVENANAALASARDAAESVAQASADLPALGERLQGIAAQAEALIATYGARSDANRELLAALREIREAGRSISALARSIQRNPNSLLLGR